MSLQSLSHNSYLIRSKVRACRCYISRAYFGLRLLEWEALMAGKHELFICESDLGGLEQSRR